MKISLKLTLLLLLPFCGFAQEQKGAKNFKKTLELGQKNQKPILLIINPDYPPEMQAKIPVNLMLKDRELIKKATENFQVFNTKRTDTSVRTVISLYKINRFPAFVFLHPSKDVFHIDFGYSSTNQKYLAMLDKAMLMSKEKSVSDLEKEHLENPADLTLLKQLIDLRKKNGRLDNAEYIEKYVQKLKVSDFEDYQTVLFILSAGPYAYGPAYKLAYTNPKVAESIYKKESLQLRTTINNAIIGNTMVNAVKTKNRIQAQSAASFSRSTWGSDYLKGQKSFNTQMLYYYSTTKDTTNYFKLAIQHFDMYYMNLGADSIKKVEEKERLAMLERMRPMANKNIVSKEKLDSIRKANPTASVTRTESVITSLPSSNYANDLNNIAYGFYQTGTKNLNYLTKAMLWSKRAVELNPMWAYYDTLAHIYYAMGIQNEALTTLKQAMDLAKKEHNSAYLARANKDYAKMKNKTL